MSADKTGSKTFSDHEKAAMKARARELAAEERMNKKRAVGENAVLETIAEMTGTDRKFAVRIHKLVAAAAPDLWPRTWYGMPAYARDGKVVCFFQSAGKFEARYATFGFNDVATLDTGSMWPTSFAIVKLTEKEEKKITALVKKAVRRLS